MKPILKSKISLILAFLIIFFIVLNFTGLAKETKNFFYLISSPIQKTFWQLGMKTSDFFEGVFEMKNLKEEKENLQLKIEELKSENVVLKELKKENEILREALNIGLAKEFQLQLSQIISKDNSQDSILINKGLKDGAKKGLPVITSQKTLLGRIGQVFQNFSEVILISNKESSFDAKISEREIYGVIRGRGNLEVYFDLIPKDEEIFEGEIIVTTSLGGIFPQGILVGVVKEIRRIDIEPFQSTQVLSSFDLKKLDNLFIITDF